MNPVLIFLVGFGMCAVCLCFVVLMPVMGNLMAGLFGVAMGEQAVAHLQGKPSGCEQISGDDAVRQA